MKTCFTNTGLRILILSILMAGPLAAQERRDRFDFDPPPPREEPLVGYLPTDSEARTGLLIASGGLLAGTTLTLIAAGSTINKGLSNPSGADMQRNLALTGTCLIGTAVCTVFFDYYLSKKREEARRRSSLTLTSEE